MPSLITHASQFRLDTIFPNALVDKTFVSCINTLKYKNTCYRHILLLVLFEQIVLKLCLNIHPHISVLVFKNVTV